MRPWVWSVALLVLTSSTLASAGSAPTPVRAEIDHRLDALLEGQVSTGATAVLASVGETQVPLLKGFHLQARNAQATIIRMSGPSAAISLNDLPPLALASQDIEQNDEEIEHRFFHDLSVLPIQSSALWNAVAFGRPGDRLQVALPEGSYLLGQAPEKPSLLRPEVPRTKTLMTEFEPATKGAANALEVRAEKLYATYRGDFLILLYGASFAFNSPDGHERIDTGTYEANYHVKGGLLPERRQVNAIVLLRVQDGTLGLSAGDAPLALYAREVLLDGRATFDQPVGTLHWQDRAEVADADTRTLEGDLRIVTRGPAYARGDGQRFGPLTIEGYALAPVPAGSVPIVAIAAVGGALAAGAGIRWIPGVRRLLLAAVAGFSLVQKDEALEHRARAQLYDYVKANPGATLSVAQTHLGIGWGTVEYHVAVLERLGLLTTKRAGGKRLLFAATQGRVVDPAAWGLMRNPSVRQLAATSLAPGRTASQVEIAQALDCSPQYAGRLVRKLVEAGLVAPALESSRRAFAATELFHDLARRTGLVQAPVEVPELAAPLTV